MKYRPLVLFGPQGLLDFGCDSTSSHSTDLYTTPYANTYPRVDKKFYTGSEKNRYPHSFEFSLCSIVYPNNHCLLIILLPDGAFETGNSTSSKFSPTRVNPIMPSCTHFDSRWGLACSHILPWCQNEHLIVLDCDSQLGYKLVHINMETENHCWFVIYSHHLSNWVSGCYTKWQSDIGMRECAKL